MYHIMINELEQSGVFHIFSSPSLPLLKFTSLSTGAPLSLLLILAAKGGGRSFFSKSLYTDAPGMHVIQRRLGSRHSVQRSAHSSERDQGLELS